jgi:Ca-activated chloride channel family protein
MRSTLCAVVWCGLATMLAAEDSTSAPVNLQCSLAEPVMRDDIASTQPNFLKVSLIGRPLEPQRERAPVNVALVIDKSGSMQGEKIERAKQGLLAAIDRLGAQDIVTIVAYDTVVQTVLPATKLTDREQIRAAINSLSANGNTALFAGVSKGAAELRKFRSESRFNRVILLSDGLANVGPSSPEALAELGSSLAAEGISVTTLGLGLDYNEDLLARLAATSGGSHAFISDADRLAATLQNEFDDVLSVVASDCQIVIDCGPGIRPVRIFNAEGTIDGSKVYITQSQVYGGQERYILIEVEVDPQTPSVSDRQLRATVEYYDLLHRGRTQSVQPIKATYGAAEEVLAHQNLDVLSKYELLVADERNREATRLRDEGRIDDARQLLRDNSIRLKTFYEGVDKSGKLPASDLYMLKLSEQGNSAQAEELDKDWSRSRKQMLELQNTVRGQQSYGGAGKVAMPPSKKQP